MRFEELKTAVEVVDDVLNLAAHLSELDNHKSTELDRLVIRELDIKLDAMHFTNTEYTVAERFLMHMKEFVMDIQDQLPQQ